MDKTEALELSERQHNILIGVVDLLATLACGGNSEISFSTLVDVGEAGSYEAMELGDAVVFLDQHIVPR